MGGLFCEKIFGPLISFECICKNYKRKNFRRKNKDQLLFCPKCNVQLISSSIRRYRMGYCVLYLNHILFLLVSLRYIILYLIYLFRFVLLNLLSCPRK